MAAAGIVGLTARLGGLSEFTAGINSMNTSLLGFATSSRTAATDLQAATSNFQEFNNASRGIDQSIGQITQTVNTFTAPLKALGGVMGQVAASAVGFTTQLVGALASVGTAFLSVGVAAGIGLAAVGTALATGLASTIPTAAAFQQEIVDLGAVARATPQEIAQVEEAVKQMATQFAISIPEIQRTALELVKAGLPADAVASGVLKVTLALQQLSKGELSAEQAGQGIGSLFKLFENQFKTSGQSVEDFSLRIANSVAAVANNTRATIGEVISGINRLAPTLAVRGQQLEDIFTALNVVLAKGIRGEEAGTGLRNLFNFIINPSKEALATIKELGLQDISPFDINGNFRPALDILRSISTVFNDTSRLSEATREKASSELFQTRAATIAAIVRQAGPEGIAEFQQQLARTNVIQQAAEQMDTLTRQFERFKNEVGLAAIAFGQNFLGALTKAGKGITDFFAGPGPIPLASQVGSAAGAGAFSLLTGQGQGEAFTQISQTFGQDVAGTFGTVFNTVEKIRPSVLSLVDNLGTLKDTVIGIIFPEGPGEAIEKFGGFIQGALDLSNRFVGFLIENLPGIAKNFGILTGETGKFLDKIIGIVTGGKGLDALPPIWESLQPLISGSRDSLDGVATSAANFVKTLIDNREPILGFLEKMVGFFTAIDRLLLGIATNAANFAGIVSDPKFLLLFGPPPVKAAVAAGLLNDKKNEISNQLSAGNSQINSFNSSNPSAAANATVNEFNGVLLEIPPEQRQASIGPLAPPAPPAPEPVFGPPLPFDLRTMRPSLEPVGPPPLPLDLRGQRPALEPPAPSTSPINPISGTFVEPTFEDIERLQAAQAAVEAIAAAQQSPTGGAGGGSDTSGVIPPDLIRIAAAAKQAADAAQRMRDRVNESVEDMTRQSGQNFRQFERALAGIDERFNDTMESLEEQARDSLENLIESFQNNKRQLEESFQIRFDEQQIQVAFQQEQEDNKRTFDQMMEDRRTARQRDREDNDTDASRQTEDRLKTFQQGLDREDRAHQRSIDTQNTQFSRGQEDRSRIFSQAQEDAARRFSEGFEFQNVNRQRGFEDTDRQKQLARELAKAKTGDDRKALQDRFREETQDLRDKRVRENQELAIRKTQEQAQLGFRRAQETSLLGFRRSQEDVATDRRNQQAEDEVGFRFGLELRFLAERRLAEDVERVRRRLEDQKELLRRRQEEENEIIPFGREQQQAQRNQQFEFAQAALDRALAENEQRLGIGLTKLDQQVTRGVNRAERTAARERASAGQQFIDQEINGTQRLADLETDLNRQRIKEIEKLKIEDPTLSSPKSQEALAALTGTSGAIARAQAVASAQNIINQQRAQGAIDAANTRMADLRGTANTALSGLLTDIRELRLLAEGPGNVITFSVVAQSPQAERLTAAIIDLTTKIENIKPGVSIGTIEQNIQEPGDAGEAVQSIRTIGVGV